ncbi:MAG TPA: hemolysin family protein [Mycobacteriales bacterium]|nr:hemolysin family protein [Mycobacteriales bacterium]
MSGTWSDALLVLLFVLLGGCFSAAEIALVSLRESQVKALVERGARGERLAKLVSDPNRFLAAVQVGVTLAGFFSAAFGAATLAEPFGDLLRRVGLPDGLSDTLAFVGITILISYVSLVLGELAPKRLALQRTEALALLAAAPLDRIATLARPVIWLLSKTTDGVVRLAGGDPGANREAITDEELRGLVAAHESLPADERKLIDDVFSAGDRQVREVMVPRTEVDFLDIGTTVSRAARVAREAPHSRYPVARRDSDDVIGFVHIRDLLDPDVPGGRAATVGGLAREVKRLPGTKKVLSALSEMRREGHHLAIVEDEYGGTDGIVTLEDLIEELIGDIRDEYDEAGAAPARPGGPAEVDGLLNLDDLFEQTGLRLPEGPYETAAGWAMWKLGRLPVRGDTLTARPEGTERTDPDDASQGLWTVEILALDGRRASRLKVVPPEAVPPLPPAEHPADHPADDRAEHPADHPAAPPERGSATASAAG